MASWFLTNCRYVESHKPEHTYTFTGNCVVTGEEYSVTVRGPDLYRYNNGELIQRAFPYLSAGDREFLITGMSPAGWAQTFGSPDDDDTDDDDIEDAQCSECGETPDALYSDGKCEECTGVPDMDQSNT